MEERGLPLFVMITLLAQSRKKFVPRIPREAKPFYFPVGQTAILFLHGFTDSLCRVNGFARYLAQKGVSVRGILLPGHGQTWRELAKTSPTDWYRAAQKELIKLSQNHKRVYVVGLSFGGNLALKLAAEHPKIVQGVVTFESPMSIRWQKLIKFGIPIFRVLGWPYWNKKFLRRINHPDKGIIFRQGVLDKMPIVNIAQVIDFLEHRQDFLSKVKCDVLIVQSRKSNLITRYSAKSIYKAINSKRKKIMLIDNFYHALLDEKEKQRIFEAAIKFFSIKI